MDVHQAIKLLQNSVKTKKDHPQLQQAVEIIAEKACSYIIENLNYLEGKPYGAKAIKNAFIKLADIDPRLVLENSKYLENKDYGYDVIKKSYENLSVRAPGWILSKHADILKNKDYGEKIIKAAYRNLMLDVQEFSVYVDNDLLKKLEKKPYGNELIKLGFQNYHNSNSNAYFSIIENLNYLETKTYGKALLKETFLRLKDDADIVSENLTYIEKQPYGELILKNINTIDPLEINQTFNNRHFSDDKERFNLVKYLTTSKKYDLISIGASECYTSTYNYIFKDLLKDLKDKNKNLTDILSAEQMDRLDIFLESAAKFGKIKEAIEVIPKDKLESVCSKLIDDISKTKSLENTTALLNIMIALEGDNKQVVELKKFLEKKIKDNYANTKHQDEKDRLGLLAASYAKNSKSISEENKVFFIGLGEKARYKQTQSSQLNAANLVDNKGVCNQLMIFPPDDDGKNSFEHWKNQYSNKPGWKIEEKENYVIISNNTGKIPVCIWANKPEKFGNDESDKNATEDIYRDLAKRQGNKEPSFQVLIARGHSYNKDKYINLISPHMKSVKLVFLGMCGGSSKISETLDRAPEAHICFSNSTGTMRVNDPMLYNINESIVKKGKLDWREQANYLKELDPNSDYQLQSIDVTLIKRYNEIKKNDKTQANLKNVEPYKNSEGKGIFDDFINNVNKSCEETASSLNNLWLNLENKAKRFFEIDQKSR